MVDMVATIELVMAERCREMEKTINALKARQNLGQILEEVYYTGAQYIVERAGKPMAAVVPIGQYMQWKEQRERFFAMIDEVRERNRDVAAEVIEAEVEEAVREVRGNKTRASG
jgi:prevent-host-death family protein